MAAADALSGRNIWVGIGKQTAKGTIAAPTKFFEVTDIGGLLEEFESKKSDRRVGTRFKGVGYKTSKKVPISLTVEANPQNIGLLLMLAMGTDAVAASGAAYRHTISLAENLSYFTLWASTDQVADNVADDTVHVIPDCKFGSVKLDATTDDVLKLSFEGVGTYRTYAFVSKTGIAGTGENLSDDITGITSTAGILPGMTISGTNIPAATTVVSIAATALVMSAAASGAVEAFSVAAPVPTFPTARSFFVKAEEGTGKVEIGANIAGLAQFDEGTEFHFALSSGVAPDMRIDNTSTAAALREGDSEMTGNMKAVFNRNSFAEIEAFQAGTFRTLRFTATSTELAATGQPFALILTLEKTRYSGAPASFDPDVITADMQYEAEKTTSYPTIQIVNADSAAY